MKKVRKNEKQKNRMKATTQREKEKERDTLERCCEERWSGDDL